jgi:hypothetical protein
MKDIDCTLFLFWDILIVVTLIYINHVRDDQQVLDWPPVQQTGRLSLVRVTNAAFDICHGIRLWENVDTTNIVGQDVCYKLAYDTDYGIWRFQSADCAGTAYGTICWNMNLIING